MKKALLNIIVVVIVFLMIFTRLQAQQSVMSMHAMAGYSNTSESARISARIIIAQKATQNIPLDFGIIFPDGANSKIEISPSGKLKVSGEVALKDNSTSPASYLISGDNSEICNISLPDTPSILTNSRNSKTITVSDWRTEYISKQEEASIDQEIGLGATLHVGSKDENPAGVYVGTYSVTFMYN